MKNSIGKIHILVRQQILIIYVYNRKRGQWETAITKMIIN